MYCQLACGRDFICLDQDIDLKSILCDNLGYEPYKCRISCKSIESFLRAYVKKRNRNFLVTFLAAHKNLYFWEELQEHR